MRRVEGCVFDLSRRINHKSVEDLSPEDTAYLETGIENHIEKDIVVECQAIDCQGSMRARNFGRLAVVSLTTVSGSHPCNRTPIYWDIQNS